MAVSTPIGAQVVGGVVASGQILVGTGTNTAAGSANITAAAGAITLGVAGSAAGSLILSGSTSGAVTLKGAAAAGTWTLTFPNTNGDAGQVLTTDGNGVCSWATPEAGGSSLTVEANTAGSGAPNVLLADESGKFLTNEGATAEQYNTLPTAAANLEFTAYCQDADGIRVTANTGDTIRIGGLVSAAAGYIRTTEIGACVKLVAINATEWVAQTVPVGTWEIA